MYRLYILLCMLVYIVPAPVVRQSCSAVIDPQTGRYNVTYMWSLVDVDCAWLASIEQFQALLTKPHNPNTTATIFRRPVQVDFI